MYTHTGRGGAGIFEGGAESDTSPVNPPRNTPGGSPATETKKQKQIRGQKGSESETKISLL